MPRRMTTKGFLLAECNRLLGFEKPTTSLKKLFEGSRERSGARAREYVLLLAVERAQLARLEKLVDDAGCGYLRVGEGDSFGRLIAAAKPYEGGAEAFLEHCGESLGKRFSQVLDLLHAQEARQDNDMRVKALMRENILSALSESSRSPYGMVRDLGLNKGNAYAYLRGDVSKVSRATARRMLEYVQREG